MCFSDREADADKNEDGGDVRRKKTSKRKRVRMQESDESDDDGLRIHLEENEREDHDGVVSIPEHEVIDQTETDKTTDILPDKNEDSDNEDVTRQEHEEQIENSIVDEEGNVSRKRDRSEGEESESSDDDLDIPLIRTKRARQVLDDYDDDDDE